jgi:hypothetical protein
VGRDASVNSHGVSGQPTADTMRDTADSLERSEASLHDSAERSPEPETARRLHALGDAVTREAKAIEKRAEAIAPPVTGHDAEDA